MNLRFADRIEKLPAYLFAEMDRVRRELLQKGVDVIDLSIGDPDLATPQVIVDRLAKEIRNSEHHRYPSYQGSERFRAAAAHWYAERFGVELDPSKEVVALIGSKEGLAHFPLAFVNPGDPVLVPDPGYPVYANATLFAGGTPVSMPLRKENQFLVDLKEIDSSVASKAKFLFLNYPNNPTSAVADKAYFEDVVRFAQKHGILVCHDAAYTEVCYRGFEPPSFLEAEGAKDVAVEFHSLSKTFNMTGWRVGFAVGNAKAIAGIAKVKTNVDSGVFTAIQEAGIEALEHWKALRDANNRIYEHRLELVAAGLRKVGVSFTVPKATFYVWCEVPKGEGSAAFCERLLRNAGVSLTPGVGFGKAGDAFFRISLTASEVRLQEALRRMEQHL